LQILKRKKNKTEREFLQFKISTNRESYDFLQIETENQTEREFLKFKFLTNRKIEGFRLKMTILTNRESSFF
jgi:hypothetical protein